MRTKQLTELQGIVDAVNDRGIKINGEWTNFSKYAKNLPEFRKGQAVTLLLDGDFVMGVAGGNNGAASHEQDLAPRPVAQSGGAAPSAVSSDRERLIVRQSSLKAAVDLAAIAAQTNPDAASSANVLLVAARFEKWVMREGE